jgi:hypothetical protein
VGQVLSKRFAALAALTAALATLVAVAPPATAAPATNGVTVPATCTDPVTADPVSCTLTLTGFTAQNGTLQAVLTLTNNVTGASTQIIASLTAVTQQQGGSCTLLDLTIRPIDLDLLGLHLHTDTIHLVLTAQRGTLLGNLLCGLFFGDPAGAATTLNQLLRQGGIAVA